MRRHFKVMVSCCTLCHRLCLIIFYIFYFTPETRQIWSDLFTRFKLGNNAIRIQYMASLLSHCLLCVQIDSTLKFWEEGRMWWPLGMTTFDIYRRAKYGSASNWRRSTYFNIRTNYKIIGLSYWSIEMLSHEHFYKKIICEKKKKKEDEEGEEREKERGERKRERERRERWLKKLFRILWPDETKRLCDIVTGARLGSQSKRSN